MKKISFAFIAIMFVLNISAQNKKESKILSRAADHIVLQLSSDHWIGAPDSIKNHMKGLSRGLNVYVMLDKPFKNSPNLSVAFGIGIGTSGVYFKNMGIDIKSKTAILPFNNLDTLDHFKKYKLATSYLEVPVEFRYTANPEKENKSIKAAIGFKVGTLLNAHTKGKTLQDKDGNNINTYTLKEISNKRFLSSTRISATARIGYGNFSLFGSYQLNNIFKDGAAADTRLFQVGLTLSGL